MVTVFVVASVKYKYGCATCIEAAIAGIALGTWLEIVKLRTAEELLFADSVMLEVTPPTVGRLTGKPALENGTLALADCG